MSNKTALPFTPEEYWVWKAKFEAGYGQPRPGVGAEEVAREIAEIPEGMRHTYIAEKYLSKEKLGGGKDVVDNKED